MTARAETGVAFIAELRGGGSVARPVATVTASGNGHRLVTTFNGRGHGNRPTGEPLTTVTTIERHGLITRHFGNVGGNPARHTTPAGYDTETVRQVCRDFISSPNYWRRSLRIWVTPPEPPTGEQVCPEVGQ